MMTFAKALEELKTILKKICNRETVLYAVIGVLTSLLNLSLFQLLILLGLNYKISNIITLIIVKIAAYVLNKNIVFRSHCKDLLGLLSEMTRYIITRGATMIIDYFGLILLVEKIGLQKLYAKAIVVVIVVVLNYIFGKMAVFKDITNSNKQKEN